MLHAYVPFLLTSYAVCAHHTVVLANSGMDIAVMRILKLQHAETLCCCCSSRLQPYRNLRHEHDSAADPVYQRFQSGASAIIPSATEKYCWRLQGAHQALETIHY